MAQKTLNAAIVISGKVDNSFGQIGEALTNLHSQLDQISSELLDFGKESLEVYKNYEYSMTELETVWGSNGTFAKGSKELKSAMSSMGEAVSEWAGNSIFHTNDVANALVEAAHAGWTFDEMMQGIPDAMALAQAGGMDLSTALDYIVKAQKSLGLEFRQLPDFMDMWIYAANNSAGTAEEFAQTMIKMGSTMRFATDPAELLVLTAAMANMGSTGTEAGTLIRNSMLRILAPSGVASKFLEMLGATDEDLNAIMEDQGKMNALDEVYSRGFSAFDENGQAKSILQIYREFGEILADIAGGYENISKNETTLGILANIFGARGITGATNLLTELHEAESLYNELTAGAAEGTTSYVQETMNQTLYGSEELMKSKIEELQRQVGEELSGPMEQLQGFIGDIAESLANMDDSKFSAVVSAATTLVGMTAGIGAAAGAFRLLGWVLSPAGIIGTAFVGLSMLTSAINTLNEKNLSDQFGNMSLDESEIMEYITGLSGGFETAYENVEKFRNSLDQAVQDYMDAGSSLSSDVLTMVLTGSTPTMNERDALLKKADSMMEYVLAALTGSNDMSTEFWTMLFGGAGEEADADTLGTMLTLLGTASGEAQAEAMSIGAQIRQALIDGFTDGFTNDDYLQILGMMKEYNALVARAQAEAASEAEYIEMQKMLYKSQTLSYDEMRQYVGAAAEKRDANIEKLYDDYLTQYFILKNAGADEKTLAEAEDWYNRNAAKHYAEYDRFIMDMYEGRLAESDLGADYMRAMGIADMYLSGGLSEENALGLMTQLFGGSKYSGTGSSTGNTRAQLNVATGGWVYSMGGEDEVASRIEMYERTGDTEMANRMRRMFAAEQLLMNYFTVDRAGNLDWDFMNLLGNFQTRATADHIDDSGNRGRRRDFLEGEAREGETPYDVEKATTILGLLSDNAQDFFNTILSDSDGQEQMAAYGRMSQTEQNILGDMIDKLGEIYDYEKITQSMGQRNAQEGSAWRDAFGAFTAMNQKAGVSLEPTLGDTETAAEISEEIGPVEVGIEIPDTSGEAQAQRDILERIFSRPITQEVIVASTSAFFGTTTKALHKHLLSGSAWKPFELQADGGRETKPSIFAEAGVPEWYIPERHDARTAELILGAMYGSGFDIFDMAEMVGARAWADGGTSGAALDWGSIADSAMDGGSSGVTVEYSPTIHADNADGVERILREDKERLRALIEQWWEDRELYHSITAY